jgi:uncharacterized membrane protein YphA (DoxX/SURF4 family)
VPIFLGHGFLGFQPPKLERYGLWSLLHEARTDVSMWLGLVFLSIVGAGAWSLDAWQLSREKHAHAQFSR